MIWDFPESVVGGIFDGFFDFFSLSRTIIICFSVVFCLLVFSFINIKKFKKIRFSIKETIVFIGVVIVAILLSGEKFGFYGMGQDQGVYQTKAIEFIFENNSNVQNFDYALKTLSDSEDYTYFRDKVRELQGFYLVGQTEPFYADENAGGESGLEGVYHGLPTWPAILALFGRLFGMGNMQQCQTIFYVCYLMLVFYILENFRIKALYEVLGLSVLGTTPLVIWVSKSALTEMFLTVIMAAFVYFACHENRDVRLFIFIPVTIFSVYHVSVYTLMPLFVICKDLVGIDVLGFGFRQISHDREEVGRDLRRRGDLPVRGRRGGFRGLYQLIIRIFHQGSLEEELLDHLFRFAARGRRGDLAPRLAKTRAVLALFIDADRRVTRAAGAALVQLMSDKIKFPALRLHVRDLPAVGRVSAEKLQKHLVHHPSLAFALR